MSELPIDSLEGVGATLRAVAKSLNLSLTGLIGDGGSNMISLGNGRKVIDDLSVGPLLRTLNRGGWELVGRPVSGDGVIVTREGALPLKIVGVDGGPIEVPVREMSDVAQLLQTMALANSKTVSRMVKDAGTLSTALVGLATGTTKYKDVRLLNLLKIMSSAQFAMFARPQFQNRRQARLRAEVSRLLPAK